MLSGFNLIQPSLQNIHELLLSLFYGRCVVIIGGTWVLNPSDAHHLQYDRQNGLAQIMQKASRHGPAVVHSINIDNVGSSFQMIKVPLILQSHRLPMESRESSGTMIFEPIVTEPTGIQRAGIGIAGPDDQVGTALEFPNKSSATFSRPTPITSHETRVFAIGHFRHLVKAIRSIVAFDQTAANSKASVEFFKGRERIVYENLADTGVLCLSIFSSAKMAGTMYTTPSSTRVSRS